ncbi:MAG: hypothetical protein ACT4O3_06435 [Elusimicrobiota bacterium]
MKRRFLLAVGAAVLLGQEPSQAAFKTRFYSARTLSLGGSFASSADEAAAVFINPAGLSTLSSPEASFMYGKPFAGLPDVNLSLNQAAAAVPTRHGVVGFGLGTFQAQGLLEERTVGLAFGREIYKGIHGGVGVKHLYHSYKIGSDPVAPLFKNGASRSAVALDAGLSVPIIQALKFNMAVRNINEPDAGVLGKDRVPREIQAGFGLDLGGRGLRASSDLFFRNTPGKGGMVPAMGLEKLMPRKDFALRFGFNPDEFAAGFGVMKGRLGFDYAFVLNRRLLQDNAGSHRVSFTYRFNRLNSRSAPRASLPLKIQEPVRAATRPAPAPAAMKPSPKPPTRRTAPAAAPAKKPSPAKRKAAKPAPKPIVISLP